MVVDCICIFVVGDIDGEVDMASTLTFACNADFNGDLDVDGTSNLDVVDIDGAVDMASTLAVGGVVTANAGVVVDNITIDGTEIDLSSGDLTLDVAGSIVFDADDGNIKFKDASVTFGQIQNGSGSQFIMQGLVSNQDMIFKVNDGGSTINALTFDASDAGAATFNNSVTATQVAIGDGSAGGTSAILFSEKVSSRGKIKNKHGTHPEV